MSDTTERNDDGTFAAGEPDTTGLYGREERLVSAGYSVRKDPVDEQATPDYLAEAGEDPIRQAAQELQESREEPFELSPAELLRNTVEADPKEAITVAQAANDLAAAGAELSRFVEGADLNKIAEQVDAARAEVIKGDPEMAKHLGVEDPKDAPKAKAETVDAATAAAIDGTAGLEDATKAALKVPQVRQALEHHFAEIETAQRGYTEALQTANQFAMANLVDHFPELGSIPVEQWESGLNILAQHDPARFSRAMGVLQRVGQLQSAQQHLQHQQAQAQHQQFEATVTSEDARLEQLLGKAGADEANAATISYLSGHGVARNQMLQVFQANPVLQSAEARQTIWEAAKYRAMTKSAPRATAKIPPVHRPGTAPATPRGDAPSAKMQALQSQLKSARGDRAVRIASQIEALRRNAS